MEHVIQDDIIHRAISYFGLRGPIGHSYEGTVVPVVLIGDLGQPTVMQSFSSVGEGNSIFTVPQSETWRPIMMSGEYLQTGGTAPTTGLVLEARNPSVATPRFRFPFYYGTEQPSQMKNPALNAAGIPWHVAFPRDFTLPSGWSLRFNNAILAGDGTRSVTNVVILYVRIFESLVQAE